jgi:hypothetical protein
MWVWAFAGNVKSFMYLSDAGIYVTAGWHECAVEGREFVLACSETGGGEFVDLVRAAGGVFRRDGQGKVIVKEIFLRSSFG